MLAKDAARAKELLDELLAMLQRQAAFRWVADALQLTAVLLASSRSCSEAACALGTASVLRSEAGERVGGTRVVASAVVALADWLPGELGVEEFETELQRGRSRPPEAALGPHWRPLQVWTVVAAVTPAGVPPDDV